MSRSIFANGHNIDVIKNGQVIATNVDAQFAPTDVCPYKSSDASGRSGRRDGLGTTHHEAGTLRMGDDPNKSVTDANCRFHQCHQRVCRRARRSFPRSARRTRCSPALRSSAGSGTI